MTSGSLQEETPLLSEDERFDRAMTHRPVTCSVRIRSSHLGLSKIRLRIKEGPFTVADHVILFDWAGKCTRISLGVRSEIQTLYLPFNERQDSI